MQVIIEVCKHPFPYPKESAKKGLTEEILTVHRESNADPTEEGATVVEALGINPRTVSQTPKQDPTRSQNAR